ncbi:hypothetical protein MTO96_018717 [Rhipicephalus appendiculatus]
MSNTPSTPGEGAGETPVSPAATNSGNQPRISDDGTKVNIMFPIPQALVCPKEGCYTKYAGVNWTSRRQSLLRHLLDEHRMKVTAAYTCTICSDPDLGPRPTNHACISRGRHELQANAPLAHKCPDCPMTFPKQERALQPCPNPQEDGSGTADNHDSSPNSSSHDSSYRDSYR